MTLAKKLGLLAASAAVLTLGTLAVTPPASATPLIAAQTAQSVSASHENLDITLFFGGNRDDHHYDHDWHRDWHHDWHRDWRNDHHDDGGNWR